ncbi:hypothetical protein [Cohnella caldifontis]|uniref:hypothetical protein n=1 Tax=Cohnella caldifontis TaxID=3027471 RepID=UPI0023EAF7B6|nr:hypothetical protein [Cohnella sp. YIM B05605]
MSPGHYEFAELKPEVVDEIRQAESKISELSGHPITLIAYQPDSEFRSTDSPAGTET